MKGFNVLDVHQFVKLVQMVVHVLLVKQTFYIKVNAYHNAQLIILTPIKFVLNVQLTAMQNYHLVNVDLVKLENFYNMDYVLNNVVQDFIKIIIVINVFLVQKIVNLVIKIIV